MNAVILDAFEKDNSVGTGLEKLLREENIEYTCFKLRDMNIKRCLACGACADRTPGKCVINDDMQDVFKAIAKGDWIILATPLRFGGYSSLLKLVVDRFMVLGLPLYYVRKGTLFHRTRYDQKKMLGIALVEKEIEGAEENFNNIVSQNAANLNYKHASLVFKASEGKDKIEMDIRRVLKGVGK